VGSQASTATSTLWFGNSVADIDDDDDDDSLASSHTTKTFVSARTLLLVVNYKGEAVKDVCHLVVDDDAGPSNMATTCPSQFAADMSIGS
jgi:hypothetical protein